jgi:LacI family transcriptional regulator
MSTVNRVLHEPDKVREETIRLVLEAAEAIGFYGVASIKGSLKSGRPKIRVGILLLQRTRAFYRNLSQALETAAKAISENEVVIQIEYLDELTPQNVSDGLLRLAETSDVLGVVAPEHPIVAAAIEQLAAKNIKTFALISQLTARCNVGYVGLDAWKLGAQRGGHSTTCARLQAKSAYSSGTTAIAVRKPMRAAFDRTSANTRAGSSCLRRARHLRRRALHGK